MPLYEMTFIVRQDVPEHEVNKITESFVGIIKEQKGKVLKKENWGLRDLAYPIKKCLKGYYVLLGIELSYEGLTELERKMKLSEDVIRHVSFNVDEISETPSPIIAPEGEGDEIVISGRRKSDQKDRQNAN